MAGANPTEPGHGYVLETLPTNTPDQFSFRNATFDEVLEELSSRFILNLPEEELAEVERVCFQIEQAHWYYEDFIREENPSLPSYSLKKFSEILFHACPLLHHWSHDHETAFNDFMEYKTRVPVCGAVMLNDALTKCILVKGWKASAGWSFPRGKVNENEDEALCAAREVLEETGYNLNGQIRRELCIKLRVKHQPVTLFVVPDVPEDFEFRTQTRKEISKIDWFKLSELPGWKKTPVNSNHKFYLIHPVIGQLKAIVRALRKARKTERSAPETLQINGASSYPPTSDARQLAQAKLSSDSLVADHCQIGSTETEMSSSQSSSADPHTPSVHGDLSPHTFGETFTMKNLLTVDSEGRPLQHMTEMHLDRVSPVNVDAQNHLSLLMNKLTESESSLTPQAVTPTPVISEPSIEASPSPSSVNVRERHGPSSSSSLSTVCPAPASVASPQPPPPTVAPAIPPEADLIKRTRQLQLLNSVMAEQSTKVASVPPHTAHLFGNFPPPPPVNSAPNTFPIRSASVRPTAPVLQYTQPPYHPPPPHVPAVPNHSKVLPAPSPHILQHQPLIRSPPVVPHSIMNRPNVPIPRPSTALSSQMYMASNLPRNLAHIGGATIDPGHRGQMLAILSGNSPQSGPKSPSAGYMGHRATSSLAMPAQRNGNARLLSILNEGRGPMAR